MTDGPVDIHLDRLGDGLVAAQRRAERRRRSLLTGAATGVVAIAIALGAFVAVPGGERLDLVERARAALAPGGGLLHWVVTFESLGPEGSQGSERLRPQGGASATEVWTATSGPVGWRMRDPADGRPRTCMTQRFIDPLGTMGDIALVSPAEFAGDGATNTTYSAFSRRSWIVEIPAEHRGTYGPETLSVTGPRGGGDRDPVETIRGALASGRLRDAGTAQRDGRTLRRLVGTAPAAAPDPIEDRKARRGSARAVDVRPDELTYLVDAETSAPVELRTRRHVVWSRAGGRLHMKWITNVERFSTFERLPDTPENRKLLTIDTAPGTTTVRVPEPSQELRQRLRRRIEIGQDAPTAADRAALRRCQAARTR